MYTRQTNMQLYNTNMKLQLFWQLVKYVKSLCVTACEVTTVEITGHVELCHTKFHVRGAIFHL